MPVSADSLLPISWRKEDLSRAYVFALGVAAGVAWEIPSRDVNACDARFYARDDDDEDGPQLAVQLKCTESGLRRSRKHPGSWRFSLEADDYNRLRRERAHPPRILVVVKCPPAPAHWLSTASPTEIVMYAQAWWVSLKGEPGLPDGQASVTVTLPEHQRFDVSALVANMRSCP